MGRLLMRFKNYFLVVIILLCCNVKLSAQDNFNITVKVAVSDAVKKSYKKGGRLLFHLTSQTDKEPRNNSEVTVGYTPENWDSNKIVAINTANKKVLTNGAKKLVGHYGQKYFIQVVYKQN